MSDKKRIEELERRVRELEMRPISYPVYLPYPVYPAPYNPWYPVLPPSYPYYVPLGPTWTADAVVSGTFIAGSAVAVTS